VASLGSKTPSRYASKVRSVSRIAKAQMPIGHEDSI